MLDFCQIVDNASLEIKCKCSFYSYSKRESILDAKAVFFKYSKKGILYTITVFAFSIWFQFLNYSNKKKVVITKIVKFHRRKKSSAETYNGIIWFIIPF